KVFKFPQ
ncbi:ATP-dependent protease La, partial [Chlamydia psittaci 03DC29]